MSSSSSSSSSCISILSRLHDDTCEVSDRLRRSTGPGEYMLHSRMSSVNTKDDCFMRDGILVESKFDVGVESQLRNGQVLTKDGTKEPSGTLNVVPGIAHSCKERSDRECARLESDMTRERSCSTVVERMDWFDRHVMPPASCAHAEMQKPVHIIQEDASHNWVRGGIHSRSNKY